MCRRRYDHARVGLHVITLVCLLLLLCGAAPSSASATAGGGIEAAAYSRQLSVYGEPGQRSLQQASVLLTGDQGVAMREVVKNLVLSGVTRLDVLLPPQWLTQQRRLVVSEFRRELAAFAVQWNPSVRLDFVGEVPEGGGRGRGRTERTSASPYDVCITCAGGPALGGEDGDGLLAHAVSVNEWCRTQGARSTQGQHRHDAPPQSQLPDSSRRPLRHIVCASRGLCGAVFADYGHGTEAAHAPLGDYLPYLDSEASSTASLGGESGRLAVAHHLQRTGIGTSNRAAQSEEAQAAYDRVLLLALAYGDGCRDAPAESQQHPTPKMRRQHMQRALARKLAAMASAASGDAVQAAEKAVTSSRSSGKTASADSREDVEQQRRRQYQRDLSRLTTHERHAIKRVAAQWHGDDTAPEHPSMACSVAAVAAHEAVKAIIHGGGGGGTGSGSGSGSGSEEVGRFGRSPLRQWLTMESFGPPSPAAAVAAAPGGEDGALSGLNIVVVGAGAIGCEVLKLLAMHGAGGRGGGASRRRSGGPSTSHDGGSVVRSRRKRARRASGPIERATSAAPVAPQVLPGGRLLQMRGGGQEVDGTGRGRRWSGGGHRGAGSVTVIDDDSIELSNLNRQMLFSRDTIGQPKATVAAEKTRQLAAARRRHFPFTDDVNVRGIVGRVDEAVFSSLMGKNKTGAAEVGPGASAAIAAALRDADIVVSAVDSVETRRLLDAICDYSEGDSAGYVGESAVEPGKGAKTKRTWLVDGGTTGLLGSTHVVVPWVSELYHDAGAGTSAGASGRASSMEPSADGDSGGAEDGEREGDFGDLVPVCSIKDRPTTALHCILWAKQAAFDDVLGASGDSRGSEGGSGPIGLLADLHGMVSQPASVRSRELLGGLLLRRVAASVGSGAEGEGEGEGRQNRALLRARVDQCAALVRLMGALRGVGAADGGAGVHPRDSLGERGNNDLYALRRARHAEMRQRHQQRIAESGSSEASWRQKASEASLSFALATFDALFGPSGGDPEEGQVKVPGVIFDARNMEHAQFVTGLSWALLAAQLKEKQQLQSLTRDSAEHARYVNRALEKLTEAAEEDEEADGEHQNKGPGDGDGDAADARLQEQLLSMVRHGGGLEGLVSVPFAKDDVALGHVDYLTAAANIRAKQHGIAAVAQGGGGSAISAVQVHQVAGRIIPAVVTTTSLVASLMVQEALKAATVLRQAGKYVQNVESFVARQRWEEVREQRGERGRRETHQKWSLLGGITGLLFGSPHVQQNESKTPLLALTAEEKAYYTSQFYTHNRESIRERFRNYFVSMSSGGGEGIVMLHAPPMERREEL